MPKRASATIDLDFGPQSYWDHADSASAILQNIKGQVRREMVRDFIEGTAPAQLGAIEPELLESEVETEYTATRLTSGRPLSLRQLIKFIDEIEGGFHENTGHSFVVNIIIGGAEGDVDFATVQSELYPQLKKYYRKRLDAWAAELAAERAAEDGDDDQEPEENE